MDFTKIGLCDYESKIYTAMLGLKRGNADEISTVSGVPKTAVYPNLKSLIDKGLIQTFNSKPAEYCILPPQNAIKNYLVQKEKEKEETNKKIIEEAKLWYNEKFEKQEKQNNIINLTKGRELSIDFYLSNMKNAKKSYYILGWRLEKIGDKYTLLHKLKEMRKRGIEIKLIVTGFGEKRRDLIEDYKKSGIKIKYLPIDNFSMLIIDGKVCKLTLKNKELEDKYNIEIFDSDLSGAMNNYFCMLWDKANEY